MGEPAVWFVCVLGVAVVFLGLLFLVGIILITNLICDGLFNKKQQTENEKTTVAQSDTTQDNNANIENRQEILAAVCAAVAEENNTDISAIRVISFKRV